LCRPVQSRPLWWRLLASAIEADIRYSFSLSSGFKISWPMATGSGKGGTGTANKAPPHPSAGGPNDVGTCPVCFKADIRVTAGGALYNHGPRAAPCQGVGKPPLILQA